MIYDKSPKEEFMNYIYDRIHLLFTRFGCNLLPNSHFVIFMGIKILIGYAKSAEIKKDNGDVIKLPIDVNKNIIDDPIGPLDPRLVYPNLPQVLLALKMTMRGEDIPPNTRLEFVYIENDKATHQGEKAEDYTYYRENKDIEDLKIDSLHYIEKQLCNPLAEMLNVKFKYELIPYITLNDQLRGLINNLNDLHRYRVANIKQNSKIRPLRNGKKDTYYIGWDVLKKEGCKKIPKREFDSDFSHYKYKGSDAQVDYILEEMKKNDINAISSSDYPGLKKLCCLWKSICIINKLYKQHGLTRPRWNRPTYVNESIRLNVEVVIIVEYGDLKVGMKCKIINVINEGTKKNPICFYDLLILNIEKVVEKVGRKYFTTFTYKDNNVMDKLLKYRVCYKEVVCHLNRLFRDL
jgi:hypothetical protein